jgi:Fe-S cluster assembly ATP-binding protein
MLEVRDLHARIGDKPILKGLSLTVAPGEVVAIMGPNASGKSTLSKVIAGHPDYEVTGGDILLDGVSILDWAPEDRARAGIFLAFQYPVAIPGLRTATFLQSAVNAVRKHRGEPELDAHAFLKLARERMKLVGMTDALLKRPLNEGFSGGEKKRNEIFQMTLLEPRLGILDETDSGLDIDALRTVADGVNALRSPERGFLVITHYQRLLDHITPDRTLIQRDGQIVMEGGPELALSLEKHGYKWVDDQLQAAGA